MLGDAPQRAICLAIQEPSTRETVRQLELHQSAADLVEIRADSIRDLDVAALLAACEKPVIWTCRASWEGGHFEGPERRRLEVLEAGARAGATYVDVEGASEFAAGAAALLAPAKVIVSRHCFDPGLPELPALFSELESIPGDVFKVAVTPASDEQLLQLLDEMPALLSRGNRVLIGLGERSKPARLLGALWGNCWTYASAAAGRETGSGQLTLTELREEYRLQEVPADCFFCAVVGNPVSHSLSPKLHNFWFLEKGLPGFYFALELEQFDTLVVRDRCWPLRGLSVTIPHKVAALQACDFVEDSARQAGAVNTMHYRDGGWWGSNTDVEGFLTPLRARIPDLKDQNVTLLGAGGAARAAALALGDSGCRLHIYNRNVERAGQLAADLGGESCRWDKLDEASGRVLVNATAIGMRGEEPPLRLRPGQFEVVYDMVYNRRPTPLLQQARQLGMKVIGGEEMFVEQAARQFERWTDSPLSESERRAGFERIFGDV